MSGDLAGKWAAKFHTSFSPDSGIKDAMPPGTVAIIYDDESAHVTLNFENHLTGEYLFPRECIRNYFSRIN